MITIKDIQISFVGMEPTEALKKYVVEKIEKHEHLWEEATSIEVFLKENVYSKGVEHDFRIDINVSLPNSTVRVEVSGPDMYANIDEASDILARRLKRYIDKKSYWDGATPWKVLEADAQLKRPVEIIEDYSDYVPSISVRKKIENMSPLEEGEAIEQMELLGHDFFIYYRVSDNKENLAVLYRRKDGGYGVLVPELR